MNETLRKSAEFFTAETGIMSCLSVSCGTREREEYAWVGDLAGDRTVFDLASVTKLFTGLCLMRLREEGRLDLSRPASFYAPEFRDLEDVTVEQLMSFAVTIRTPGRIDACRDREEGLRCLRGARCDGIPGRRAYSDIPAMILKYVIEGAAGEPLYACVRKRILLPAGMTETWARVPENRLGDCQRYSGEYRLIRGQGVLRNGPEPGTPHDPKAELLQGRDGDLCGHAGLFSTRRDLVRFCRALLDGRLAEAGSLRDMARNRTGRRMPEGGWSQFLGLMCYVRHPDQYFSEIPAYMSRQAFGIGGFTGNHLSVDPERGRFAVFLGNRVLNRLTVVIPEEGKNLEDYGLAADGRGWILREDGVRVPSSVEYVHQKDEHLHRVIAELMGWEQTPFEGPETAL